MGPIYEEHDSSLKAALSDNATLFSHSDIEINSIIYEISGVCNAKCTYCPTGSGVTKGKPARFIPPEEFSRGLDRLYELNLLNNDIFFGLYNWGDPLLHPQLDEILKVLNEEDQSFALSSNGSVVPKNLNSSLLENLSYFRISLPGFSQQSYDRIHQLNFDKVLHNINVLKELAPPNTLEVTLYAYKFNIEEISRALEYFSNKNIRFQVGMPHLMDYEDAIGYLTETIDPVKKQRIEDDLFTDHIKPLLLHKRDKKSCPYLQNQLVIDEYNNVLTCCVLSKNSEDYIVGPLFELTKDEIFDVKTRGRSICLQCMSAGVPYWYEFNCRYLPRELQTFNAQTHCYINTGRGFSEEQKVSFNINPKASKTPFRIFFDLRRFNGIKSIRWDPVEGRLCSISIDKIQIEMKNGDVRLIEAAELNTNGDCISGNEIRFNTIDPWVIIPTEGLIDNITILGSWLFKSVDETMPYLNQEVILLDEKIQSLQHTVMDRGAQISSLDEQIEQLTEENQSLQKTIVNRDAQVASLNERVQQQAIQSIRLTNELASMQQSIVWRLLMKFHNGFVERFLPLSTRRRRFYDFGLSGCRHLLNEGPLKAWSTFVQSYISRIDCTKPCEIICNSPVPFQELNNFKELPRIAIIVVTYNSANFVKSALDSVLRLDYPLSLLELIVVDNNSTDNIEQIIHDFNQANAGKIAIKFIRNKKNYGFGKGNNIGASHASADVQYLLLLNPDCQLYEDTLGRLISSALSSVDRRFRLWECRQLPYEHPKHYNPVTLETTWSSAACCLIERAAFEEIRGFDENIFLYLEDVDLSWRLRMAGYRLMYLPLARALHNSYSEPNEVKATMYYNSLLYGYHMRYKFGSFWDILKYGGVYWYLICSPPNNLKNERKNLFMGYLKHFLLIPSALAFRIKNRRYSGSFRPLFYGFDFETHRPGAFVDLMNTEEGNVNPLPKVSIIVRTIGRKGFLREALVSIRNQTYPNVEVILVEDGPATLQEMLQSEFGDLDLKYFPLGENHGRSYAGTFGMAKSTGRYLRFLDEDDLLFAHSVETAVSFILKNKEKIKLVYDLAYEVPTEVVSEDPLQYKEYGYNVVIDEDFSRANLFHHNYIPIQCALFDRELYETCGGFDERLEVLEDWDLWIRYSMETDFLKIPMVTSLYRVPSDQNLRKRRQELLDSYYATVRKKYAPRIKGWKIKNY